MDNVTRYAAVNAKVRALEGRLLEDNDYTKLLSKKNVNEVAVYLKQNTHYGSMLGDIDESQFHRIKVETLLKKSHIEGLQSLVHYFSDEYREFYRSLFIRYEIEDLKIILRGIKTDNRNITPKDSFTHIGKYSKNIDMDALLSSKTISDFIKNLKDTIYFSQLRHLMEGKDRENINLFIVEMTLDLAYFDLFYKNLGLIQKSDRKVMEYIQGINVDLLNLQWIYRGLKFYNLPPEELFNYTIGYGYEFSRDRIKELCYSRDLTEFQNNILETKYSFLFDVENTRDIFMERRILRYQYFKLGELKRKSRLDISQVFLYSLFLEYEVRDIISIIESIRYGMPVEEAKKFLIRKL